jgi:arylsulfatase A-like enzyme
MDERPNIILILCDDMGFSDIGCYGSEIQTKALDKLAKNGVCFTQFYNTPRCSPSRASLLTGLHPHQTGVGILTQNQLPHGYSGDLNRSCVTIAEVLKENNYSTYMCGKWHVCNDFYNSGNWPMQRGFEEYYGPIGGGGNYYCPIALTRNNSNIEDEAIKDKKFYLTDAISDSAIKYIINHIRHNKAKPYFLYLAYTAPHWPLHALEEDIAKYKGYFDKGWDILREEKLKRMKKLGIVNQDCELSPKDDLLVDWADIENKEWELRRMEVYAAQIDRMDQGIGKIVKELKKNGTFNNTLIIFLSDNGGCSEELVYPGKGFVEAGFSKKYTKNKKKIKFGNNQSIMPGSEDTYQSYGRAWANLSNTPFRLYKHWAHEGGISTPFIIHWPLGIKRKGTLCHSPAHIIDIMPTILEVTKTKYPKYYNGNKIPPPEGKNIINMLNKSLQYERMLFWEHEGNAAIRYHNWKLVKKFNNKWELYNIEKDRSESENLAEQNIEKVEYMKNAYEKWAIGCGVIPYEKILKYCESNKKDPDGVKA